MNSEPKSGMDTKTEVAHPKTRLHSLNINVSEKIACHITYALYAASVFTGVPALLGVILSHLIRSDVRDTWLDSHVVWQIKTFWIMFALTVIGTITFYLLIGALILGLTWLWFTYRTIKGWIKLNNEEPIENPHAFF